VSSNARTLAATDGSDKLKYFVGVDNPPLMKARREMSEEDYVRFVRGDLFEEQIRACRSKLILGLWAL
jgi:hypothetical protein